MDALPVGALDNPMNLAVLLVIAVLLFGKQLPEVMRTFGNGIRELRQAANFEDMSDAVKAVNEIRGVATTTAIVRAAVPGAAEIQDSLVETKGVVDTSLEAGTVEAGVDDAAVAPVPVTLQPAPVVREPLPLVREPEPVAQEGRWGGVRYSEDAPKPIPQGPPPLPTPAGHTGPPPALPYLADPWVERPVLPVPDAAAKADADASVGDDADNVV